MLKIENFSLTVNINVPPEVVQMLDKLIHPQPLTINEEAFLRNSAEISAPFSQKEIDMAPTSGTAEAMRVVNKIAAAAGGERKRTRTCPQCDQPRAFNCFTTRDGVKHDTCNKCRDLAGKNKALGRQAAASLEKMARVDCSPKPVTTIKMADGDTIDLSKRDQICNDCKRHVDTYKEPFTGGICIDCTVPEMRSAAWQYHRASLQKRIAAGEKIDCAPGAADNREESA